MAHKFIKKVGKYYRINSDNTQTEVQLKDGYFHWTQPDKVKVRVKLDNNLTDMDKSESLLNKIGRMFTNATIGAANADSPAVMTASGWSRNKDGSWSQTDSKGAQELRRNLAVLSGTAYIPTAMATAPLIAPGTTGGAVIGNAAGSMAIGTALEEGQRAVTSQSAGDIISSRLQQAGVPSILADAARPEYYINPTGAAAKTAWNAGNRAVRSSTQYVSRVRGRYNDANIHIAPESEIQQYVATQYSPIPKREYYSAVDVRPKFDGDLIKSPGGIRIKPGSTMEIHINPDVYYAYEDGMIGDVVKHNLAPNARREAVMAIKKAPLGTPLTNSVKAKSLPQIVQQLPFRDRMLFYLKGRIPELKTQLLPGYSTDIMELFNSTANKMGKVVPSLTTRMNSLNGYGTSWNKYSKYFADDKAFFSEMSPEQVALWNKEQASATGIYIDPKTRTAEHKILITK